MGVEGGARNGKRGLLATLSTFLLCVLLAVAPERAKASSSAPVRACSTDAFIRQLVVARSNDELAKSILVLHLYGSGPDTATAAQQRANLALYGHATPSAVVAAWKPAGVILINRNAQDTARAQLNTGNVVSTAQLRRLTSGLRKNDPSLLVSIDQEGGRVNRLRSIIGAVPSALVAGASEDATRAVSDSTATRLRGVGINVNFAPVADVVPTGTPTNGIIGDRSFGADPAIVASRVVTAADALQKRGVAAVVKHWPGHGSTTVDSHVNTPTLDFSRSDVEERNLGPFRAATTKDVAAVMVGHLAVPAWDPSGRPATISKPILQRLRSSYCGVIVSDSLWMGGVRRFGIDSALSIEALDAGMDLLLMPVEVSTLVTAVRDRADRDPEFRSRLIESNIRIETLRRRYRI